MVCNVRMAVAPLESLTFSTDIPGGGIGGGHSEGGQSRLPLTWSMLKVELRLRRLVPKEGLS